MQASANSSFIVFLPLHKEPYKKIYQFQKAWHTQAICTWFSFSDHNTDFCEETRCCSSKGRKVQILFSYYCKWGIMLMKEQPKAHRCVVVE